MVIIWLITCQVHIMVPFGQDSLIMSFKSIESSETRRNLLLNHITAHQIVTDS